jgi:hypothetical protein
VIRSSSLLATVLAVVLAGCGMGAERTATERERGRCAADYVVDGRVVMTASIPCILPDGK